MSISSVVIHRSILNMLNKILILALVCTSLAGDHHGDGHDGNCVDISRYGEIQYNVTTVDVCSYKIERNCTPRSKQICVEIPKVSCRIETHTECGNQPFVTVQRSDTTEEQSFITQECAQDGVQFLQEVKKMPVCTTVTKQQCDSKWVINEAGEKVWDGNENCRDVSWEDCVLEDKIITEEVPTYTCQPGIAITYSTPVLNSEEVTTYDQTCRPVANSICTDTKATECTSVEWEECVEDVQESCGPVTFNIPYQEFEHTLRCTVSAENPSGVPLPSPVAAPLPAPAPSPAPAPATYPVPIPTPSPVVIPAPTAGPVPVIPEDCQCIRQVSRCFECEVSCTANCTDLRHGADRCYSKQACRNW